MFTKDATNTGVSEEEQQELDTDLNPDADVDEFEKDSTQRPKSRREEMMDIVYGRRVEELKADGVKFDDDEDEDTDNDDDGGSEDETVTVTVDGVKTTLTRKEFDEQVREYQKHKAADKRMDEAALKLKELEKREKELEEKLKEKPTEDDDKKKDVDVATLDGYQELFEDFATKIRDGNDKDAVAATKEFAQALAKMVPSANSKSVDEQVRDAISAIKQEEEQKLQEEEQAAQAEEIEKAKSAFSEKFEKELKNNDFYELAVMEDNKLLRDPEWSDKPLTERFLQAGENAKKWLRGKGDNADIKNKKRNLKSIQTRSDKSQLKDSSEEETPMSASDVIAEMKKDRGQMY